jgi:translation initiation factor 1
MSTDRLVYSTDRGRGAAPPRESVAARPAAAAPRLPADGVIRLFRERAGRGGKVVTVVRGLAERGAALEALAQELKRLTGAGGTVRDGAVEIQGDHRARVAGHLRVLGRAVKLAGGP